MSEYKNGKLQLPNVTLAAMDSVRVRASVKALEYSMKDIDFGEVLIITHRKPLFLPKGIQYRHIDKLKNIDAFNYNMIYKIHEYIHTDYMLLVHYDGFVVNPDMWRDEFLDYDYIGSPFPLPKDDFSYRDAGGNICRVGNSVSIRHLFEAEGMRYAPLEVAKYFGHESMIPEVEGIRPFVFHKWAGTNKEYPKFY